jgi:hypothetical protein
MADLPLQNADPYEKELLKWVEERILEGEAILKTDPAYDEIDKAISYIMGDQLDPRRPDGLASVVDNRLKNILLQTVAALTDIHPIFGIKSDNPNFQPQADLLNNLSRAWWTGTFADLALADVIRFSAGIGTGYCEVQWDASASGGAGDIKLIPRDPRDIIPIKPTIGGSVQDWEGVMIRTSMSLEALKARYPEKAALFTPDTNPGSSTNRTWKKLKAGVSKFVSPAVERLFNTQAQNTVPKMASTDLYYIYYKDRRLHNGTNPITMGDPETTWSYEVFPIGYEKKTGITNEFGIEETEPATREDARLYPGCRLIICTKTVLCYDGPSPYWHGKFPVCRLMMDPWPWSLLGQGMCRDLLPLQDALNELLNGVLDYVRKALRPGVIADKKVIPESLWQRMDTRRSGLKLKANMASAMGKGLELTKSDPLPSYVFDFLKFTVGELDYLSGVANLTALTQLNQAPGADSIEKMLEALTPILRLRGRLMEAFLREVGEMVIGDFFQFYTLPRRLAILGDNGVDLADFDFDPGKLVPSMQDEDPNYDPAYSWKVPRSERAKKHLRHFAFQITPNSLLAISQLSRKLLYLQLFRAGMMDPWTLFEVLEIPNGGQPPMEATTITDRLMLANEMGLGQAVSPTGRKASGQASPQMAVKNDENGPRVTITES